MTQEHISKDEFCSQREKHIVNGTLYKGFRSAPSWNEKKRSARFVMSAEVEDRDGDVILTSGINVDDFAKNPTALVFHGRGSSQWPIGHWADLEKLMLGRPKRLEGTLNLLPEGKEADADRVAIHLQHGTMGACSIGFVPNFDEIEIRSVLRPDGSKTSRGYLLKMVTLVECSPVPVPSNPMALVKAAKEGQTLAINLIEEVLDTWARDPKTNILIPRAEYEAAHRAATGERTSVTLPPGPDDEVVAEAKPPAEARSLIRRTLDVLFPREKDAEIDAVLSAAQAQEPPAPAAAEQTKQPTASIPDESAMLAEAIDQAERKALEREVAAALKRVALKAA